MSLWPWVGLGILLVVTYYFVGWLFGLIVLLLIVYIIYRLYRWFERLSTPHGKRIRHGMLRGHLQQQYGTKEGDKVYKEIVGKLRKEGYR